MSRRKSTRFSPDPLDIAIVDFREGAKGVFKGTQAALILDESPKGCSIAVANYDAVKAGDTFRVKIGNLDPLLVEVRWVKAYSTNVTALGLKYLF